MNLNLTVCLLTYLGLCTYLWGQNYPAEGTQLLVPTAEPEQIWQHILAENEGKVIYLDLWATWCGPCIREFPASKALNEQYNGRDVAFISLCLSGNEPQWRALLQRHQLPGTHYFLNEAQVDFIDKLFKVKYFPTYVILDKQGKPRKKGFKFRPSNPQTASLIDRFLK